jgi:hypothetical protein
MKLTPQTPPLPSDPDSLICRVTISLPAELETAKITAITVLFLYYQDALRPDSFVNESIVEPGGGEFFDSQDEEVKRFSGSAVLELGGKELILSFDRSASSSKKALRGEYVCRVKGRALQVAKQSRRGKGG